jgi:hypothetical protein
MPQPKPAAKFESANGFMPSAVRRVGRGTLELRGMFSAEAFTFPPGGSPLLFQTGETYKGEPLIDRQHPHDLFMELSANYTVPVGERASWFVYAGYPGEPALGPNAFMHRASASENTSAPLSHHLQDSTHIAFGVVTGGARDIWNPKSTSVAIGSDVTFYSKPPILDSIYGSNPVSWKVFVRVRPGSMNMSSMHGTH